MQSINFHLLETEILAAMTAASVPGLALGIIDKNRLIYARGFGLTSVEDGGVPITPQTIFRIGSITKCLTGTAVMRLVDSGRLSLDRPVSCYVPELCKLQTTSETPITIRMLMNHTAGFPTEVNDHGRRDCEALSRRVRDEIPYYPLLFPPGRLWSYSNPGIDILGYIIATEVGTSFPVAMDQILFGPLEMMRTTFDPTVAMTYPLALSHDLDETGALRVRHKFAENAGEHPDGFAMSTVLDLANFAIMHMQGGCFKESQFLTADAVAQMHEPSVDLYLTRGTEYGLTFFTEMYKGIRRVWHEGAIDRFGSKLIMMPTAGTAVIFLCNRAADFWRAANQIIDHIIDRLLDLREDESKTTAVALDAISWKACVGDYRGVSCGIVSLRTEQDQPVLIWKNRRVSLRCMRRDLYCADDDSEERFSVGIISETDGSVNYIVLNGDPCERTLDISEPDPECWAAYEGVYVGVATASIDRIIVRVTHGRMSLYTSAEGNTLPCIPWGLTRFRCHFGELEFQLDGEGRAHAMCVKNRIFKKIDV